MKVKIHLLLVPLLALTLVATALLAPQTATTVRSGAFGNNILARNMDIELGRAQPSPHEQLLSSGVIYTALQASGELDRRAAAVARTGRRSGAAVERENPGLPE